MIRRNRKTVSEPQSLHKKNRGGLSELELAQQHMASPNRRTSFQFKAYKNTDVRNALERLFHGKCAYCESFYTRTQPVDIEHYRPKNEVEGVENHEGYWWLAMDWNNLLPSCIDCNRRRCQTIVIEGADTVAALLKGRSSQNSLARQAGKKSSFPLAKGSPRAFNEGDTEILEQEQRLLIDPCRDDPDEHLVFHIDRDNLISLVYPRPVLSDNRSDPRRTSDDFRRDENQHHKVSEMGAVSILVYGLNRLGLVQARTRHLREMEFLLQLLFALEEIVFEIDDLRSQSGPTEREFLDRIQSKLKHQGDSIKTKLRRMTHEDAPYSALAQAWVKAVLERALRE